MKILFSLYLVLIASFVFRADENATFIETLNFDSDPDDNIIEVTELYSVSFGCDVKAISGLEKATDIDHMRPTDVSVIGAIGDSMTAAMFAKVKNVLGLIPAFVDKYKLEYRGVSWSIGGDFGVTTLPNFIREYNPDLKGFSVGTGKEGSSNAGYNFAVSGAVASGLLEQANNIVSRIKSDNLDDEWKVITLFIGGNDLCAICNDEVKYSPENFYLNVKVAIEKIAELKKIFINLVQTVEITQVSLLSSNFGCSILQGLMKFLNKCGCISAAGVAEKHQAYKDMIDKLEVFFRDTPVYEKRDDFAVVVQPFFGITTIPSKNPLSYFAPDCFHLSQLGHVNAATDLWNNMLQPVGSKDDELLVGQQVICPTLEHPYIYTHQNSATFSVNSQVNEGTPEEQRKALSTGQIAGIIIGTLVVLVAGIGLAIAGVLGYYVKYRKPKFSEYTSLNKKIRY